MDNLKKAKNIEHVAIFGSAHASPDSELATKVFAVCKRLAETGYIVVNGGGPGVMRAATMGAKQGGGQVIGIVLEPGEWMHYEGRDLENKFDIEINAKNYVDRTVSLMREGQIYVVFNGGTGTISEFGMAWGLAKLYFWHHKPLILYGKFWENIMAAFLSNMRMLPEEFQVYRVVNSPEEVVKSLELFEMILQHDSHAFNPAEKAFEL